MAKDFSAEIEKLRGRIKFHENMENLGMVEMLKLRVEKLERTNNGDALDRGNIRTPDCPHE